MMRQRRIPGGTVWDIVLVGLLLLGVLAALRVAVPRAVWEAGYRTVELIIDAESVLHVARRAGADAGAVFAALRDRGVTSVAVRERRVEDLISHGAVALVRPGELAAAAGDGAPAWLSVPFGRLDPAAPAEEQAAYLVWQPGALSADDEEALTARLLSVGGALVAADPVVWEIPARTPEAPRNLANPAEGTKSIGLGFDEGQLRAFGELGLGIALRPLDSPGFAAGDVDVRLRALDHVPEGRSLVVFDGAAVPGQPGSLGAWVEGLSAVAAPVAWIEFAVQRGLDRLVMESGGGAVRLHSIGGPELHGLEPGTAVARWVRAVVERSVRALYLRFYTESPPGYPALTGQELLDLNLSYVGAIAAGLEQRGFALGPAAALRLPAVGAAVVFVIFLSVAAATLLLLRLFVRLPAAVEVLCFVAVAGAFSVLGGYTGRKLAAFAASVIFPSLAAVGILRRLAGAGKERAWLKALAGLGAAALVSFIGALYVVGLLSETPFAIGIDLFWGVKAMHVLPPLLIAGAFLWERPVCGARDFAEQATAMLRRPIPLGYVLLLGALAALALVVVLRTGTDLLPVPGFEQWLRTTLENTLGVRPRNKEFLLGHPLFVLTAYLVVRLRPPSLVTATGAALAGIGQLSLVNTFAHIHAPLAVSLLRTLYGVVLGGLLGVAATGVLALLLRIRARGEG